MVACPICEESMIFAGQADYYDRSSRYKTPMYFCTLCDIFYRDVDHRVLIDHYYAVAYVLLGLPVTQLQKLFMKGTPSAVI